MRPKMSASRPSSSFSRRFKLLRTLMSRSVKDWNVPPLSRNASLRWSWVWARTASRRAKARSR